MHNRSEILKKILAMVFTKGYDDNQELYSIKDKWNLAETILKEKAFVNLVLSQKSLINYFDHFFWNSPRISANPSQDKIEAFIEFIGFDSYNHFVQAQPSNEGYLMKVPFSIHMLDVSYEEVTEEEVIQIAEIVEEKTEESKTTSRPKIVIKRIESRKGSVKINIKETRSDSDIKITDIISDKANNLDV